jgi:hypothetical protein
MHAEDWSWAIERVMRSTVMVYSGTYSISYTPENYDGLYFNCDGCLDTSLVIIIFLILFFTFKRLS